MLTNRDAGTVADAVELIDWYRARWEIKILLNILKNAFKVDALKLGSIEKLERALALFMVVAWRISHLMRLGRTCPDLDAELFFDPDEIQAAYLLHDKVAPTAPRLNEVLRQTAPIGASLIEMAMENPLSRRFGLV